RGAPRLERRPQAQPVGPSLPGDYQGPAQPQDQPRAGAAARRDPRIPRPRDRRSDVRLDLDPRRPEGLQLGRGGLDPRGQCADEQCGAGAGVPRLQDLPRLRQSAVNVFVTGGTGFVGAHLVRALQERGDRVTCLVRRPELAERLGWRDVRLVRGDLDDAAALLQGCEGAELVFHVAGKIVAKNVDEFMATNRDGTANVLEAAQEHGVTRFVLVSSLAAAGPTTV